MTELCAGTYTVFLSDGAGGLYNTTVTISEPSQIGGTFVDVDETVLCNGSSTVTAFGGIPGYTYIWDDPLGQTTPTASGLCEGMSCVQIIDDIGCTETLCTTIQSFVGIEELQVQMKEVAKIIDITGRETKFKPNTVLIYIYNDGSHQRFMINE